MCPKKHLNYILSGSNPGRQATQNDGAGKEGSMTFFLFLTLSKSSFLHAQVARVHLTKRAKYPFSIQDAIKVYY